jgi:hypothetical protein
MTAHVTLKTGGGGAESHYGMLYQTHAIMAAPIFSRMGITLTCSDKTIFIPYANLMSLEWS